MRSLDTESDVQLLESEGRDTTPKQVKTGRKISVRVRLFSDWTTFTDNEHSLLRWTHNMNNNHPQVCVCKTKHCFQETPSRHVFCMCNPPAGSQVEKAA